MSDRDSSRPLLEISGLTLGVANTALLTDVNLSVARGSVHALLGRNGAGKTTLLRVLLGEVEFIGSVQLHFMASGRIGYVPQELARERTLALTVGEFLALTRQRRPVALGRARPLCAHISALLKQGGLAELEDQPLATLSGGEMRRVLLVQALDPLPELLLLDEPTEGLDRTGRAAFEERLHAAVQGGTTVLLVSHDLALVRALAKTATLLDARVAQSGAVTEVVEALLAAESAA